MTEAHVLKIQSQWLDRVLTGEKRAEVRRHDRDFQVGDTLLLTEVDAMGRPVHHYADGEDSGPREAAVVVTHVLDGRQAVGVIDGYCVLSIALVDISAVTE